MTNSIAPITRVQEQPQLHDINTEPEVAKYLKVSIRFLLRLRRAGKIGFTKFGGAIRYTRQQVIEYVNGNQRARQE